MNAKVWFKVIACFLCFVSDLKTAWLKLPFHRKLCSSLYLWESLGDLRIFWSSNSCRAVLGVALGQPRMCRMLWQCKSWDKENRLEHCRLLQSRRSGMAFSAQHHVLWGTEPRVGCSGESLAVACMWHLEEGLYLPREAFLTFRRQMCLVTVLSLFLVPINKK